jgi:2-dehydropantoate 2-reductase
VQNGVQNERAALRRFANVYAVCVVCPALHLEPGVVCAYGAPVTGILDIGRYPAGVDATAESVAVTFNRSTFESVTRPDIMRWKYTKLVRNLGNAIEAVCGPEARGGPLSDLVTAEAEACLRAAGIDAVPLAEDDARRGVVMPWGGPRARGRPGGSSWQSLTRATGSIETDYLNGEIVLLGRLHGVPTPANELLQDLANAAARAASPPGAVPAQDVLGRLGLT